MKPFLFAPDVTDGAGGTSSPITDTHTRHLENVPDKDSVLLSVCQTASSQWAISPFITLLWQTQADFAKLTGDFEKNLQQRNTVGGKRGQQTQALDDLDVMADDALPFMKNMIGGKWGPDKAVAYYPEFGMEHRNHHYGFPVDRQKRKDALRMMADAVAANGFGGDAAHGSAFWEDLVSRYNAALQEAVAGAGSVSDSVSGLVQTRTTLRRVLHAILLLLEANYPDTFEQERRVWGFQKEKY